MSVSPAEEQLFSTPMPLVPQNSCLKIQQGSVFRGGIFWSPKVIFLGGMMSPKKKKQRQGESYGFNTIRSPRAVELQIRVMSLSSPGSGDKRLIRKGC